MTTAIILAAGKSERMGADVDKAFLSLVDKPVVAWSLIAFERCPEIDRIVLVVRKDKLLASKEVAKRYGISKMHAIVAGGAKRQESVQSGFAACDIDTRYVVVHDSARPLITSDVIGEVVKMVKKSPAVTVGRRMVDTVKRCEKGSVVADVKKRVAQRALADACAEPSPAVIDNGICRAACAVKFTGWLAAANDRLLARYAAEPRFSIADAGKLSSEERHRLACELAAIGSDVGLAYMIKRRLVDWNDTRGGGVIHCAEAAGQKQLVKWIADVWRVKNGKTSYGCPGGK